MRRSGCSKRRSEYNASIRARRDNGERSFGSLRKICWWYFSSSDLESSASLRKTAPRKVGVDFLLADDCKYMTPCQVKRLKRRLLPILIRNEHMRVAIP